MPAGTNQGIDLHRALRSIGQTNAVLSLDTAHLCYGAPGMVGRLAGEGLWLEQEPLGLAPRLTGYLEALVTWDKGSPKRTSPRPPRSMP